MHALIFHLVMFQNTSAIIYDWINWKVFSAQETAWTVSYNCCTKIKFGASRTSRKHGIWCAQNCRLTRTPREMLANFLSTERQIISVFNLFRFPIPFIPQLFRCVFGWDSFMYVICNCRAHAAVAWYYSLYLYFEIFRVNIKLKPFPTD